MAASYDLWYGTSGPKDAQVVIVGESWGAEELLVKRPFVGSSGKILEEMLAEAGYPHARRDWLWTNTAATKPMNNDMWRLFRGKHNPTGLPKIRGLDPEPLVRSERQRLHRQIAAHPRRLIILAGNYALWALTDKTKATVPRAHNKRKLPLEIQPYIPTGAHTWRGSMLFLSPPEPELEIEGDLSEIPCLPIIHPAAIMRDWTDRAITVHDLRARIPMGLRGDWRRNPGPVCLAPPTFIEARNRLELWLARADAGHKFQLACDIETKQQLIVCIGFADSVDFAMCIPFINRAGSDFFSFWNQTEEIALFRLIQRVLTHHNILIDGQNFLYDTQYFQHWMAISPNLIHDTMLAQNVMFPGIPKTLNYLASLYNRYYWYWKDDGKEWDGEGTLEDQLKYNCLDCLHTFEVGAAQRVALERYKLTEQMQFKMEINNFCLSMMNTGVLTDQRNRSRVRMELMTALAELERELLSIVPQSDLDPEYEKNYKKSLTGKKPYVHWFRSSKQTNTVFYDILKLPVIVDRKTGNPTVGKEALNELAKKAPEFTALFEKLRLYNSADNTAGVLNAGVDPDGRMRCFFAPGGTETHRLSSSTNAFGRGTNLQNLTKGKEDD